MTAGEYFNEAYERLLDPRDADTAGGLTLGSNSHKLIHHLSNRRCKACVAEIAGLALRDALATGATVATATQDVMGCLGQLGYSLQDRLSMIRPSPAHSFKRKRRT